MVYTQIPGPDVIQRTMENMKARNFDSVLVQSKIEALEKIKQLVPAGASVMNGSSVTLHEIGFVDHLKSGQHGWNNLHEDVLNEKDPMKQALLRKQALLADYYLGSVHALTEQGEMLIASNSGSQLPHLVYSSQNIILVVSTNKITPTLDDAFKRLNDHVIPLEDKRMQAAYGMGTNLSKTFIFSKEPEFNQRKITVIFVNEQLGY